MNYFIAFSWLLILLLLLVYFLKDYYRLRQVRYWPQTQGLIKEFNWARKEKFYWANIEYQYQIDEIFYRSSRLFLPSHFFTPRSKSLRQALYQLTLAYNQQAEISVFYNPENVQEAVVIPLIPKKLNLIIGLLILLIFLQIVFLGYHLLS